MEKEQVHKIVEKEIIEIVTRKSTLIRPSGIDYRLLGLIWEKEVVKHFQQNSHLKIQNILELSKVYFNYRYELNNQKEPIIDKIKKTYLVFDGVLLSKKKKPEVIIEIKLGLQNFGLKELEYLYLFPNSKMICIVFYPSVIERENEFKEYISDILVEEFNQKYNPNPRLHLDINRISFLGKRSIGLSKIETKKLLEYEANVSYYIKTVIKMLHDIYPKMLVKRDIINFIKIHHQEVTSILLVLQNMNIVDIQTGDIKDSKGRISKSKKLYALNDQIISNSSISELISKIEYPKGLSQDQINTRTIVTDELRDNDKIILKYLSAHSKWICIPDIQESTTLTSTAEITRCLKRLVDLDRIQIKRGFLLDPTNSPSKTYETNFYKSNENSPQSSESLLRVCSPFALTFNEMQVINFLNHYGFTSPENAITMKDLSNNLDLNQSTTNIMVKRMSTQMINGIDKSFQPAISLIEKWVENENGRIRKSPVLHLKLHPFLEDWIKNDTQKIITLPSDCEITMQILDVPLSKHERLVVNAVRDGFTTLDEIANVVSINQVKKSNKSMIRTIISRLTDQQKMHDRFGDIKVLCNNENEIGIDSEFEKQLVSKL